MWAVRTEDADGATHQTWIDVWAVEAIDERGPGGCWVYMTSGGHWKVAQSAGTFADFVKKAREGGQ